MNYWLVAITPENWNVTKGLGLAVQGFSIRQRRKVERMVPGDHLLFYVMTKRLFAATATVTSTFFEDRTRHWAGSQPQEAFAHRVRIKPDALVPEGKELDAGLIAPRLEYVKRWPPELWPLALVGELHIIPRRDFEVIEWEMLKLLRPGWVPPLSTEAAAERRRRRPGRPYPAGAPDGAGVNPKPVS